jgi:hypothetical protein
MHSGLIGVRGIFHDPHARTHVTQHDSKEELVWLAPWRLLRSGIFLQPVHATTPTDHLIGDLNEYAHL